MHQLNEHILADVDDLRVHQGCLRVSLHQAHNPLHLRVNGRLRTVLLLLGTFLPEMGGFAPFSQVFVDHHLNAIRLNLQVGGNDLLLVSNLFGRLWLTLVHVMRLGFGVAVLEVDVNSMPFHLTAIVVNQLLVLISMMCVNS